MLIQGLVDVNYRFLDVCVGWPGSMHDARAFVHSASTTTLSTSTFTKQSLYLVPDSAYPLKSWLMKPFAHNTDLTTQQRNYNY